MTTSSARKGSWKKGVDGAGRDRGRTKIPTVAGEWVPASFPFLSTQQLPQPTPSLLSSPVPTRYALDLSLVEHGH